MSEPGVALEPRAVTDEDIRWWNDRNGGAVCYRVQMRGDHIGATNIEVVRSHVHGWGLTWNVPYVVPGGDGTTYWFTMHSDVFPPVSAVVQRAPGSNPGDVGAASSGPLVADTGTDPPQAQDRVPGDIPFCAGRSGAAHEPAAMKAVGDGSWWCTVCGELEAPTQ